MLIYTGGESLGVTGAKPHFIFIIYSKEEGSSMDKLVFENPLLKYIGLL
jgi:hypothetical protein